LTGRFDSAQFSGERNAPSIPAVTPAANTQLPSTTTRSLTGMAPKNGSRWNEAQCVVARRP